MLMRTFMSGLNAIQIEIAIGISQSAKHDRHAIQFKLSLSAFGLIKRLAKDKNILDRCTFQS